MLETSSLKKEFAESWNNNPVNSWSSDLIDKIVFLIIIPLYIFIYIYIWRHLFFFPILDWYK